MVPPEGERGEMREGRRERQREKRGREATAALFGPADPSSEIFISTRTLLSLSLSLSLVTFSRSLQTRERMESQKERERERKRDGRGGAPKGFLPPFSLVQRTRKREKEVSSGQRIPPFLSPFSLFSPILSPLSLSPLSFSLPKEPHEQHMDLKKSGWLALSSSHSSLSFSPLSLSFSLSLSPITKGFDGLHVPQPQLL